MRNDGLLRVTATHAGYELIAAGMFIMAACGGGKPLGLSTGALGPLWVHCPDQPFTRSHR